MTHDPKNAGEATVQQMREGDFVDGESAGPYGGTDSVEQPGHPSSTSEPAPAEHAEPAQDGESDGDGQDD